MNAEQPQQNKTELRRKLTLRDVEKIRKLYSTKMISVKMLSNEFGIAPSSVRQIIYNQSYFDAGYRPPECKRYRLKETY